MSTGLLSQNWEGEVSLIYYYHWKRWLYLYLAESVSACHRTREYDTYSQIEVVIVAVSIESLRFTSLDFAALP